MSVLPELLPIMIDLAKRKHNGTITSKKIQNDFQEKLQESILMIDLFHRTHMNTEYGMMNKYQKHILYMAMSQWKQY